MRLPEDQRVQIAYCQGLALENLGRPDEALISYNIAMTADAGASEEITRQAALRVLGIYQRDPEVLSAIKSRKTGKETIPPEAGAKLAAAEAMASLFQRSLGAGTPLPAGFRDFLKANDGK